MTERLYHIIAVNDRTGFRQQQTAYPMAHEPCCIMMSKQSDASKKAGVRFVLEQVKS